MKINIRAIEKYLPGRLVESSRLEQQLQLAEGWMEKNSGVISRHWADASETVSSIAATALKKALSKSGLTLADLDWLIYAGGSYDYPIPHNSCLIKQAMGSDDPVPCFDVDATCLSFLNALEIAQLYLLSGQKKRIAIVTADLPSRSLHPKDPKTYSLFGDAAVALILEATEAVGYSVLASRFETYSEGARWAYLPTGGAVDPHGDRPDSYRYFKMEGKKLLKLTFEKLDPFIKKYTAQTGMALTDYDFIVPHQASKVGFDLFLKKYRIDESKMAFSLPQFGNCVAASIPLGLEGYINGAGTFQGARVLLIGTAAGLTIGAVSLQF